MRVVLRTWLVVLVAALLLSCQGQLLNNPYPAEDSSKNILYSSFDERPKHLDPAQSYTESEALFTQQIYEPPLQYHYLKRPYTLIPLSATEIPKPIYVDKDDNYLSDDAPLEAVAFSIYQINIKPNAYYQPHPALAVNSQGLPAYRGLTSLKDIYTLSDFKQTGTREVVAADYVYQIKRLAHPRIHSPIFGVMSDHIVGLKEYGKTLSEAETRNRESAQSPYLDLSQYHLEGATVVDRYTYRIKIKGKYPQFVYWLAMPFFAPIPPEVEQFYAQPGMAEKNFNLDWYPLGSGPYMLTTHDPNRQMVLERNPNFSGELYPAEGEPEDYAKGLLIDAGKKMPFIEKAVFSLEKETIPYWNKFLQGYYDSSGISSESFDQAIRVDPEGEAALAPEMRAKGIYLSTSVQTSSLYFGFNMLDPVVGGYDEARRKLRLAISIALDYEEFISIFRNGRGIAAQGPIPPGIFGYVEGKEGVNPYIYDWVGDKPKRKSLAEAKRLLSEAGYPGGRGKNGKPLLLYLDTTGGGPDDKSRMDWLRKQLQNIDIQLVIRHTDYNRFQDKMLKGTAQLFQWGWNADYPDPENFLFLLHGPNSKVGKNGENAANYNNPEYNMLFEQMKNMENSPARQEIINKMVDIARRDAPWAWGFHPKQYALIHSWQKNVKVNLMARNTLKYKRIDPQLRAEKRKQWNQPVSWPLYVGLGVVVLAILPAFYTYRRREKASAK